MRHYLLSIALLCCLSLSAQEAVVFEYTGEVETYYVPECVTQLEVIVKGARGGGSQPGQGSTVSGIINVQGGQTLEIRVGGLGFCPDGGFNGGGDGGPGNNSTNNGCGGGGASDIRIAPYEYADRIIVAAGGGGMGGGSTDAQGGAGGCETGGIGNSPYGDGGAGGTLVAGGDGGPPWIADGYFGENGELGVGGTGAIDPCYNIGPGGGGGGGYFGGGGGGSDCFNSTDIGGGGGGGGSCLVPDGCSCNFGNVSTAGSITITAIEDFTISATPSNVSYCQGDSALVSLIGAEEYLWNPNGDFVVLDSSEFFVFTEEEFTYSVIGNTGICSDTIEIDVTVTPSLSSSQSVELCFGELYTLPDNSVVSSDGIYESTIQSLITGCDSVITTELNYEAQNITESEHSICDGENVTLPDGTIVSEEGSYSSQLTSLNTGCDSTILTEVIVNPSYDYYSPLTVCSDGSYNWTNGTVFTESGTYVFEYETSEGCDSIETVDIVINTEYTSTLYVEICEGEVHILPDGSPVNSEGTYTSYFSTVNGCDSNIVVHIDVVELSELELNLEESYCIGDGNVEVTPTPSGGELTGDLLTGSILQHEDANPGSYNVSYTYTNNNGCTSEVEYEYVIPSPLVPSFDYDIVCHDLYFENLTNGISSCEWYLGEDLVSVLPEFLITFYEFGDFDLELIVFDEYGCVYSEIEEVSLQEDVDLSNFFVPNVITPNQDFFNDYLELPANFTECLDYMIKIYNKWGIQVYEMTESTPAFAGRMHDGSVLPEGVYFYTLEVVNYPCLDTPELKDWCTGSITVFQ